jgi:ATP-dependent Lon protease
MESMVLEEKVKDIFGPLATDKRRLPSSGLLKLGIPSYVGEWIIDEIVPGEGQLSAEELNELTDSVNDIIPRRNEQSVYKNKLLSGDTINLLTYMSVEVDITRTKRTRDAKIPILGLNDCWISDNLVENYPDLLKQGMWGIVQLGTNDDGIRVLDFEPMQASVDLDQFYDKRNSFSSDEWRELMLISAGYNPEVYSVTEQQWILCRLLPLVQKSMHFMELAPKGTGKSFIYENISPKVRLISGGNVTPAVLFVNNSTAQEGLLARFDVVVLDEVQKLKFSFPEEIIGVLKGYMANGKITRGGKVEIASDCGLVLLANILLDEFLQPVSNLLIEDLPEFMRETAFLDRFKGIIPGWEVPKFRQEMIAESVGLKADFFSDTLTAMRNDPQHEEWVRRHIEFPENVTIRDQEAIISIASGLVKILYPNLEIIPEEFVNFALNPAIRMRQYVRDQLWVLDPEYRQNERYLEASYVSQDDNVVASGGIDSEFRDRSEVNSETMNVDVVGVLDDEPPLEREPIETHLEIEEGSMGNSYRELFAPYLQGAAHIKLVDPFIRTDYQIQNLIKFCDAIAPKEGNVNLELITKMDSEYQASEIGEKFSEIQQNLVNHRILFDFKFEEGIHDRWIETNTGWKIILGRGLDFFQRPEGKYTLDNADQSKRQCKATTITYVRVG